MSKLIIRIAQANKQYQICNTQLKRFQNSEHFRNAFHHGNTLHSLLHTL